MCRADKCLNLVIAAKNRISVTSPVSEGTPSNLPQTNIKVGKQINDYVFFSLSNFRTAITLVNILDHYTYLPI